MLGSKEQRIKGIVKQATELIDHSYDRGWKAGFEEAKRQAEEREARGSYKQGYEKGYAEGKSHVEEMILVRDFENYTDYSFVDAKRIGYEAGYKEGHEHGRNTGKSSHREKYIMVLLKISKNVTEKIYTEISEIHHDRGSRSSDLRDALMQIIEDGFCTANYKMEKPD